MKKFVSENVKWISQGGLRMNLGECVLYTDPFDVEEECHDADYILISHSHYDHYSIEDINKVIKKDTIFVFPLSMQSESENFSNYGVHLMSAFETMDFINIKIKAVPAYNIDKIQCHPKENNWLGYIINYGGYSLYYTSDTELIPEMKDITADVIFVPLGQTYTMNCVEDALKAVEYTKAKVAVPIHYGKYEGSVDDANKFVKMLENKVDALIL